MQFACIDLNCQCTTHQLQNRLDLIINDALNLFTPAETERNMGTSDHFLVKTTLEGSPLSVPSPLRHVQMYKKADWNNFRNDLAAVPWNKLLTTDEPETACSDSKDGPSFCQSS